MGITGARHVLPKRRDRFPPAGSAYGPYLTYAVRWEVVMVDIAFALFIRKAVQELFIGLQSQGDGRQNLGLTPGEQSTAVRPGKQSHLAAYGANLMGLASIRPQLVLGNGPAHFFLKYGVEDGIDELALFFVLLFSELFLVGFVGTGLHFIQEPFLSSFSLALSA